MDRRTEIIYATLELASENGLGTVSMKQIADKVGITKASLYNHFASRDEIVDAMYETLREQAKNKAGVGGLDFDQLNENVPLNVILTGMIDSYRKMTTSEEMLRFYKIIMSERSINPAAAEIMAKETKTMVNATKALFYALQVKNIANFGNVDSAAISFTMAVHSIIDYECDLIHAGMKKDKSMMTDFIEEFSRVYSAK